MSKIKFSDWLNGLPRSICPQGKYPMFSLLNGELSYYENRFEYHSDAFEQNALPTVINTVNVWENIGVPKTEIDNIYFTADEEKVTYIGGCTRPRMVMFSCQIEGIEGNNKQFQLGLFENRGEGFQLINGATIIHEFRFSDVLDHVTLNVIVRFQNNMSIKPMIRNLTDNTNARLESGRFTIL